MKITVMEGLLLNRPKTTWRFSAFLTLILLIGMLSVMKADAAIISATPSSVEKKPYEYDFVVNNSLYNGFTGAKNLVITFDKEIEEIDKNEIEIYQMGKLSQNLKIIDSVQSDGRKLTINFKNLEYVEQSKGIQFKLVIPAGKLYYDQLTAYEFPFEFHELLPGFGTIFANNSNAELINNKIFVNNAPRDVAVYLPKMYISKIETIHRSNGVLPDRQHASLTNIDILTDQDAKRMKVQFNGADSKGNRNRDLERRTDLQGFSMGQAGIEALNCADGICNNADDFQLIAYDAFGKKLTTRAFKIKVKQSKEGSTPTKNDFTINDYIKTPDKAFGQKKNLYDLMTDYKLSKPVFEQLPVNEYDKIGILYSLGDTISVTNEEQLLMALNNESFKTIKILADMDFTDMATFPKKALNINRSVTVKGEKHTMTGQVTLGDGKSDILVRLEDLSIEGQLKVDTGGNGIAVLQNIKHQDEIERVSGTVYEGNGGTMNPDLPPLDEIKQYNGTKLVYYLEAWDQGVNFDFSQMGDLSELTDLKVFFNPFSPLDLNLSKSEKTYTLKLSGKPDIQEDTTKDIYISGEHNGKTYLVNIPITVMN